MQASTPRSRTGTTVPTQKVVPGQLRNDLEDQVSNSQPICIHEGDG
jgi:hypothetical protein